MCGESPSVILYDGYGVLIGTLTNPLIALPPTTTAVYSSVAGATADTQLLAANTSRIGATIFNDSNAILYVKFGTGASSTSFTIRVPANGYYEVPFRYRGQINGYWSVAIGNARITELS